MFLERGPVDEVMMDNASYFHSGELLGLFEEWRVQVFYRAAYRASGNSIVERNHRTIKSWAEKAGIDPIQAVFYYNVSPRVAIDEDSVPQLAVNGYKWRLPFQDPQLIKRGTSDKYEIGDNVWVKPGQTRCTTKWNRGKVTAINSTNNISVDGMPRHVLDLRRVYDFYENEIAEDGPEDPGKEQPVEEDRPTSPGVRRSTRVRHPPVWMSDFVSH